MTFFTPPCYHLKPMTLDSVFPYFIIMAVLFLLAHLLVNKLPFYKKLIDNEPDGRYGSLDGLRGVLALGVLFQHAVTNWSYFETGIWQITEVKFYRFLGGEAVIIFFMITSFLYWSKAIRSKGKFDMVSLYTNRFLRLAPMYLFSALLVTMILLVYQSFYIPSFVNFIRDTLSWFTLGIVTTTSVDGVSIIPYNAGIHWTLHFEWLFYLALPVSALVLTNKHMRFLSIPILAIVLLSPYRGYWAIFIFGMIGAHIVQKFPVVKFFSKKSTALLPLAGLALVYFINYKPYSYLQYVITLGIFLCFVYGNDLLGLLKSRSAKLLGTLSYSIYLLHGIVLHIVLSIVNFFYPITTLNFNIFWLLILISGVITVIASLFTYRYIEHPWLLEIKGTKKVEESELAGRVM